MTIPESSSFTFGGEIAWRPSPQIIAASNLQRFMDQHGLPTYADLMQRSTADVAWFWSAVLDDLGIRFRKPYSQILDLSAGVPWPKWCVGGVMNIIDNCLDRYAGTPADANIALIAEHEDGSTEELTFAQLRRQVNKLAGALRQLGLKPGDAVGVFKPMTVECVVSMLAVIKIGGIFLPLFSGYGVKAVADRLIDAEAKALITADTFHRRGQVVSLKSVADEAADRAPSLKHIIVHRRGLGEIPWNPKRDVWWHDIVDHQPDDAPTHASGADDPMMLIYTSGTTGKPKGAVHTHCGFPIKAAADMLHGLDLHPDETLYWMTDMGWMMGPWLVFGTLLIGATMMVYDGAPDFPSSDRLWAMVERHQITALGVSPTLIRALLSHGEEPVRRHDLSSLRKFGSTGEPWNPEPWRWLFEVVGGGKLPIINYSGGTEISGGIVMGNVLTPLKPCAFSGPLPGMDADVVDDSGKSIRGQVGELIIRKPWIGMTRGFWKDRQRYLDAYWSRLPGVWVHGDFAAVDADGLWYILGRSDDTIKVAGKRVGPAEIESVLVAHPSVREAAVIGVPNPLSGQSLVCFCVLHPGQTACDELQLTLRQAVARELGKPLMPRKVLFVADLPRTRNAKIMRRVIRAAYLDENPGDISSLENPAAVEEIRAAR